MADDDEMERDIRAALRERRGVACAPSAINECSREKTGQEVLQEMIGMLRRRADQLERLLGALPPEMNHHASQALAGLVRESFRHV